MVYYREFKKSDFKDVKNLVNSTWRAFTDNIVSSKVTDLALGMYVKTVFNESSFCNVATYDNKVVGIVAAYKNAEKRGITSIFTNSLYLLGAVILSLIYRAKDLKVVLEINKITEIYKKLIKDRKDLYDGQLTFLAVDGNYRGKGIGKGLVKQVNDYFISKMADNYYVYTDTNCNYGFYDSQGFIKIDTAKMGYNFKNKKIPTDVFLYSKNMSNTS